MRAETMESGHYFREKGATAERLIHEIATKTFFTDWCYPNPKKPDGNELCDMLVVFDDTALIWQIKDLKVDENGRYKDAEVEKNLRQLSGAKRTLFDLKSPVMLSNPRRGVEQFDPSLIKHVHLISVLMGEGEGAFPFLQEFKKHLVHGFTREFADIAMSELDTIADFCQYLRAKESIDLNKMIMILGGEENLLGKYIEHGRSFGWMDNYDVIHIDDTIWPKISQMPQYIKKKEMDRISYGWDSMIERVHEGTSKYERLARELARPDRFTRRVLSESFMESYDEFMRKKLDMFRRQMSLLDTTYCFLITNDVEHPSKRRQAMLQAMCLVARGINQEKSRVLGVATSRDNTNYDFVFLNIPEWTSELEAEKARLQGEFGIFVSPRQTRTNSSEFPDPATT
jgi:hypothetical protein